MIKLDELKDIFEKEAIDYYKNIGREFIIDKDNKRYINLLCSYFSNDEVFESNFGGDLRKGLFVFGPVGVGKTSSLEIIRRISTKYNLKKLWFLRKSTHEIVSEFNALDKKEITIRKYTKGLVMFDDLGSEIEGSNYGKEDIFIRILEMRYDQFIDKGIKTHITSNYSFHQLKNRYGERVYDRLKEMFNFLELSGESRR
ncbi:MAG TPA: hypothetical protein EYG72_00195 [Candidatus Pacebacteria bacterium]|nr:hypothetical protein [Candidatus Paceibacterota bacterium]